MGLAVTSVNAQDPPKRLTDCQIPQPAAVAKRALTQQNFPQPHRGVWDSLDINPQQWGKIKAERIKFGRVMKLARTDLEDSIKVILRPEQLEALEERREKMKQRAERWKQGRHGSRPHRHKLPEEWKEWNDEERKAWKQERREKRKAWREKHNAEKNGKE